MGVWWFGECDVPGLVAEWKLRCKVCNGMRKVKTKLGGNGMGLSGCGLICRLRKDMSLVMQRRGFLVRAAKRRSMSALCVLYPMASCLP